MIAPEILGSGVITEEAETALEAFRSENWAFSFSGVFFPEQLQFILLNPVDTIVEEYCTGKDSFEKSVAILIEYYRHGDQNRVREFNEALFRHHGIEHWAVAAAIWNQFDLMKDLQHT